MRKLSPIVYFIGKNIMWIFFILLGRVKVYGREHVPLTGGVMLAANHTSYCDPPLLGGALPRPAYFMAKAELFKIPILGPLLMPPMGAFPVRRGSVDRQALRNAHEILLNGDALAIFFEGGRSPDGCLQPPELGAAMIALRAGVPIVPAALINADKFLPPHSIFMHVSRVAVAFGPPLTFPHLAGKTADRAGLQEVSRAIACAVADLLRTHGAAERVPEGYPDIPTAEVPRESED